MRSLLLILVAVTTFYVQINAQDWNSITREFKSLPLEKRPIPLWFWNNAEVTPSGIVSQLSEIKRAGYGGVSILPFGKDFKPKYLTEAYFDVYKVCLEEADKLGMKLHIYDEYGFPSGTAGDVNGDGVGRFKQKYPHLTNKRLDMTAYTTASQTTFSQAVSTENLMALVAMDTISFKRIDLTKQLKNGQLNWRVPKGAWKIMAFHCVNAGNSLLDYLDPEAADLYIEMTHEQYYSRFGKYFGNVVEGTFFDEPTMYYADGRTWTPKFNQKFEERHGYSPATLYPALWYSIGQDTEQARNLLFGLRADLFAEGYIGKVNEWSKAHGVHATGHLDNEEILNAVGTSGDFMKSFKYLDAPGIDKIGGNRAAEHFYKLISSAAYNWDKYLVMSETYGDMGNISWNTMFGIAMDQYAKGINTLIPHAVWYDDQKVTFKPELSLRNPLYKDSLKVFNDYLTRLNVMLRNPGRWEGDVAILYPIESMQGDHYFNGPLDYYKGGVALPYLDYTTVSVHLMDSLGYDHMYLHPEVLDEQCIVQDGKLHLQNERQHNQFSVLVIPASHSISLANLQKAQAFAKAGGTVIFTTQLPSKATQVKDQKRLTAIVEQMLRMDRVHVVTEPTVANLREVMDRAAVDYQVKFVHDAVPVIHKEWSGKHQYFFANPTASEKQIEVELRGTHALSAWNPHTGEIVEMPSISADGKESVEITLAPYKSIFLVEKEAQGSKN